MVLPHILKNERRQGGRRGLAKRRIFLRVQPGAKGSSREIIGAFQLACHETDGLLLYHLERFFRKRWMEDIVRKQAHAAIELVFEHLQRKGRSRREIGGDVIHRFLKSQAVQGGRAIGKKSIQDVGNAFLAFLASEDPCCF